jgi:hypothetical protein
MAESRPPGEPLAIDALQRDILIPQIQAFLDSTSDPAAREVYESLRAAVERLEIPPELQQRLGAIVEVALQSGRVRRLFGPGADLSMGALFLKTPRGRDIAGSIRDVNAALAKLKGQPVEEVSAALKSPGSYALTLRTSGCQVVIRLEPAGARIESLEVDLG